LSAHDPGTTVKRPSGRNLTRLLPLLIVLGLWQAASVTGVLPKSLMPSFVEVGAALSGLVRSGEIVPHTVASLARAGAGFAIAVIVGITIGVLMARVRWVQLAVEPILLLIYPVPKPALIPLFMVWLGIGNFSKIAVIALACLVPIVIATFNGARSVDPMLLWSARARGTSERRLLWRVVLPSALPQTAAGVRTAIAIAVIVLVSSEFISSETGLGYLIFSYGGVGAEDAMLAVVLYLAVLGYLLDRLYVAALRKAMAWHAFAH
jgi:NitT/TauT family transport system permease protein